MPVSDAAPPPDAIIAGHANLDLDCLGSLVLASHLFPDHRPVQGRLAHPAVREALTVYGNGLDLMDFRELKGARPSRLVVVDTRSKGRIREIWDALSAPPVTITVYDHHRNDQADIPGAKVIDGPYGAESSHLALMCRDAGLAVPPEAATLALAGIYADTMSFTNTSTTAGDFEAVRWLLERGASLKMVRRFIRPLREEGQADVFHLLMAALTWRRFHGHEVALARIDLPTQAAGVAEVVDRAFADEPVDALLALVTIRDRGHQMVIGRSRKDRVDLLELLAPFGGGGHPSAASALVKDDRDVWSQLLERLETVPKDAMTAVDLMSREVVSLPPGSTVLEASLLFEKTGYSGAPVVDAEGDLVGVMTLHDVSKARKAGAMGAPVTAYMARRIVSCAPSDTLREVERRMLGKNVGHLPVVEGTRLVGLITRGDYKRFYS